MIGATGFLPYPRRVLLRPQCRPAGWAPSKIPISPNQVSLALREGSVKQAGTFVTNGLPDNFRFRTKSTQLTSSGCRNQAGLIALRRALVQWPHAKLQGIPGAWFTLRWGRDASPAPRGIESRFDGTFHLLPGADPVPAVSCAAGHTAGGHARATAACR